MRANDVAWLIDRLDAHENVHELKSYVQSGVISGRAADIVQQLVIDPHNRSRTSPGVICIADLAARVQAWLRNNYSALDPQRVDALWHCFKTEAVAGLSLSTEAADAIFIISKNLLKNLISYGDEERDRVRFEIKAGLLRIRFSTYGHIRNDELDALTIAPIFGSDGTASYGMFLVGVLTRILNGTIFLTRQTSRPITLIDIMLPLGSAESPTLGML